ncbi:intermembrane transport protein PqiB [Uliginosibacterium paludis]|uniref:MlaD family protein n=1 Tax=Uliginosibacterium paludis TaxID=1615952 RepID=A0ABV2CKU8_9RHOO
MNPTPEDPVPTAPPAQVKRPRLHLSLVWLVPLIAAVVGLSLLVNAWLSVGPTIEISFESATGLEAGKTPVKYKDVVIGSVKSIALQRDLSRVNVTVELRKDAARFAREGSRFWVVRPRIGAGGISGIDTVLSGAYIGVDSEAQGDDQYEFQGLETPPSVIKGTPGKSFELHADDLGSLDIGSPVLFRRIQVGQVTGYKLDSDGQGVTLQIFVFAPNDAFVTTDSRFWNASGVDVSIGAEGLQVDSQSLATVVSGGIAFATPEDSAETAKPAPADSRFSLASSQKQALAKPDGAPRLLRMRFDQTMRGLTENAPVEFFGINIGHVRSVRLEYDAPRHRFPVVVDAVIYPDRLEGISEKRGPNDKDDTPTFLVPLVAKGLRAQARTGNLLTGQLYIAIDFIPNAPPVAFNPAARPLTMPTVRSSLEDLQQQVASIVTKVEKIPFDDIGRNANASIVELNKTLKNVNEGVLPEFRTTLQGTQQTLDNANRMLSENGHLQQDLGQTLDALQRSAWSLRQLTELLGRHPESLLRGRGAGSAQPAPAPVIPPMAPPAQQEKAR